ncbi:ABC transporter ATP-binding protein [Arthrobacter luteolus]|uniref:ABC transporter ATP-binding protein n=1 Tax=Arthrobacter luteolus TaxID=98672 RepID=UPI0009F95210|nr:ABC transporter ATP-binding protein [Arthrobacter luteolus]
MSQLVLEGLTKSFGVSNAVEDLSLTVESGESVVLLGPSGCGKTTTLRMIAGFETPTSGSIRIGDRLVAGPGVSVPPESREVGVVFQSYALWPHMTVAENVCFGLTTRGARKTRKYGKAELAESAANALAQVQLDGLGLRYPHELSGGQQQRVALARALVINPDVLLMDEPLSNLDTRLREDMRLEIRRLQQESGITMVYITHDRTEALGLADRIVALRAGRSQQIGPPEELYQRPLSKFVAQSLGPANVLPATVLGSDFTEAELELITGQRVTVGHPVGAAVPTAGEQVQVCIRPHDLSICADGGETNGVVTNRSFLGDENHYLVAVDGVEEVCRIFDRELTNHEPGTRVRVEALEYKLSILAHEPAGGTTGIPARAVA